MNKALLDTDILSEVGKSVDPAVLRNAIAYRQAFGRLSFSTISVMEIIKGFQKKQSLQRMHLFLSSIKTEEVIPFDQAAAELAGRILGDLDRVGRPIGVADPIIAAIALIHHLDLVTGNTAHFQQIQLLGYPLSLANWRV